MLKYNSLFHSHNTAWKVPKYAVFSGPYFPVVGLNTEIYSVFSSNKGKQGPEKTLYLDTFHARQFMKISNQFYYLYRANENLEIFIPVWFEQLTKSKQFWGFYIG